MKQMLFVHQQQSPWFRITKRHRGHQNKTENRKEREIIDVCALQVALFHSFLLPS